MSDAVSGERSGITGEALLADFREAVRIAQAISSLDSWVLAGTQRGEIVRRIQDNPLRAEKEVAVNGLATLLASKEEQSYIGGLVEQSRTLNLARFIGSKATVTAPQRGPIRGFEVANSHFIGWDGRPYNEVGFMRKKKTADVTSFSPSRGVIRIGENRHSKYNPLVFGGGFWEVHPFDPETSEAVVSIELQPKQK